MQVYTIVAGRSGTVLDEKIVQMTGAEAKAGKNLSATWFDANHTLVVTLK